MGFFDIFKKKVASANNKKSLLIKAELERLARNRIEVDVDEAGEILSPDASKIGGKPFLPADFEWPTFTNKDDGVSRPLSFFCQINLSQIAEYDTEKLLPEHGILSFFYECESFKWGFDPDDKGAARVFYFEDIAGFVPFEIPEDISDEYVMPELAVTFSANKSYPHYEELEIHSDLACEWEEYDDTLAELGIDMSEDPEGHKILGYADVIQNEMLTECERVTRGLYCGDTESYEKTSEAEAADISKKASDWTLLLQLDTIEKDSFEWMFGDCGKLYFYIRKEDLAERRFENIWFALQCG
jgi:uncharacterized protein YwqG